ncbi:general transcription factor II-I repeat domain-containing protein 2 [Trichonephila clavipes]|nr:general transcription factor II-I repeat domain-containing protein 2 [Trichonephila clavipes]
MPALIQYLDLWVTTALQVAEVLCPAQIKKISVSLSRNTVASRVEEIAENLRDQHHSTFQAYSIAIDESTDIRNIAQLAIFYSWMRY